MRSAYRAGSVYAAPNPFTYATRSDKRLLEWLSLPDWDKDLGIEPAERRILSAHVPETHLIRNENLDALTQQKKDFPFKPLHGLPDAGFSLVPPSGAHACAGLLTMARAMWRSGGWQNPACRSRGPVWTDLRVWAYRGEIFHLSGRASRRADRLDLAPPGGWLPTYAAV